MKMKTILAIALSVLLLGCWDDRKQIPERQPELKSLKAEKPPEEPAKSPEIQSGTLRIVKNFDGTYTVESYVIHPHWHSVGTGNKFSTVEEARTLKRQLEQPFADVVE